MNNDIFIKAYASDDVEEFLKLMFPPAWQGVAARILETGVEFTHDNCHWAARWSKIPLTIREGKNELATAVKSCMYRVHDCIHQLWGLPVPVEHNIETFYLYKRVVMCGEVSVLTVSEFEFAKYLFEASSPEVKEVIWKRNAIPMLYGPLLGKNILQIGLRLDDILHKKSRPKWLREHKESTAFADDYVPMLENDRENIDNNWKIMQNANWFPVGAPNSRYNPNMDGLELTSWMINDLLHLIDTDPIVDSSLRKFNRDRREKIIIPDGWNAIPFNRIRSL